jgi:tripartite-type tricarboxylate transporter receptor subunit TctC
MVEVPYRSPAQMATDVASGRVPVTVSSLAASGAMIQAGKIRPLGWFGTKRFSYQPDMPIVAETVPGVAIDAWFIIVAPTGTPTAAINRLNREINEVLKAGDIGARFAKFGLGVSETGTPNSLTAFIRSEQEKWRSLALELNLEAQ